MASKRPMLRVFVYICALMVITSVFAAIFWSRPDRHSSIYDLAYLVGPTVQNVHAGNGLLASVNDAAFVGGHVDYRAARMPFVPYVLAGIVSLVGDRYTLVDVIKTLLLLAPILCCVFLCVRAMPSFSGKFARWSVYVLLLVPFVLPQWLGNTIRMQQEEGFTYSLLALGFAILLFCSPEDRAKPLWLTLFCSCLAATYLSKSSMILVVAFLAVAYIYKLKSKLVVACVLLTLVIVPMAWGSYARLESGRFTVGTSYDGLNLHKGNNERFLEHYPPTAVLSSQGIVQVNEGGSLDPFDSELNPPVPCKGEWDCDLFHKQAGLSYIESHPLNTAIAAERKFDIFALSLKTYGSEISSKHVPHLREIFWVGLLLSRLLFWSAVATAIYCVARGSSRLRALSLLYLGTVLTVMAPYIIGFALTRHFSILLYPSSLFLCAVILASARPSITRSFQSQRNRLRHADNSAAHSGCTAHQTSPHVGSPGPPGHAGTGKVAQPTDLGRLHE